MPSFHETSTTTKRLLGKLVEDAKIQALTMHHRQPIIFMLGDKKDKRRTNAIFEPIGSIGGSADHSIIVFQTDNATNVGLGAYDRIREVCTVLTIDEVIETMAPQHGTDHQEQAMLELMIATITHISPV